MLLRKLVDMVAVVLNFLMLGLVLIIALTTLLLIFSVSSIFVLWWIPGFAESLDPVIDFGFWMVYIGISIFIPFCLISMTYTFLLVSRGERKHAG